LSTPLQLAFFARRNTRSPIASATNVSEGSHNVALSPAEIIKSLDLRPHPTCGFTNEIYRSELQVPAADLPAGYDGPRALGGFLYFLVTDRARIRLHRIRSDQMYHHYFGDPLEVLLLYPDGSSTVHVVGPDLAAGMRPQLLVPGGTFHAGRIQPLGNYALLGTSVWLRAEPSDVEMGNVEFLTSKYPAAAAELVSFTDVIENEPSSTV
jgi:predicted cupin superfamily sugar epimerase